MASCNDVIFKTKGNKYQLFVNITGNEVSLVPQELEATALKVPSKSLKFYSDLLSKKFSREIVYIDKANFCIMNKIRLTTQTVDIVSVINKNPATVQEKSLSAERKHKIFDDICSEYNDMMPDYDLSANLMQMAKYINIYKDKQSEIDLKISDIYHSIEFGNQDAVTMVKEVKALRALLRQRRNIKDCLAIINDIKANGIDGLAAVAQSIGDKLYTPRYYDDIFNEEDTK